MTNRATRFPDQTYALPCANDLYVVNGKKYRVVGIRKGSTETMCEMDVHEEADERDRQPAVTLWRAELPTLAEKNAFLKADLRDALEWLFVGAVVWHAASDKPERCCHQKPLGMFSVFIQARALYEFYCKKERTLDDARALDFCDSWTPPNSSLYRDYVQKGKPLISVCFISSMVEVNLPTPEARATLILATSTSKSSFRKRVATDYRNIFQVRKTALRESRRLGAGECVERG